MKESNADPTAASSVSSRRTVPTRRRLDSVKIVSFDAAGTLFHVRGSVGEVYAGVARSFGIGTDPAELQRSFVAAFRAHTAQGFPAGRALDPTEAEREWWMSVVRDAFGANMPKAILPAYFTRVFDLFRSAAAWELYPDSRSVLKDLRARGYRLGVISNFDSRLPDVLWNLGVDRYFERVFYSWQIGIAKPDAGIFRHALESVGVSPSQAVHIGDSLEEDAAGAQAAGLHAILLDRTGIPGSSERFLRARSLTEARSLILEW